MEGSPLLPLLSAALPWGPSCPFLRLSLAPTHNLCSLGREQDARSRAGRQGSYPSRGSGEWGSVSGTAQGVGQDWWKVLVFLSIAKKHIRDWINSSRPCLSVEGEFSSSLCVAVRTGTLPSKGMEKCVFVYSNDHLEWSIRPASHHPTHHPLGTESFSRVVLVAPLPAYTPVLRNLSSSLDASRIPWNFLPKGF